MPHAFKYEHLIATTPDWPEPGVLFRDISPLLAQRFPETIDALADVIMKMDVIPAKAGISSDLGPGRSSSSDRAMRGSGGRGDTLNNIDAFAGMDARGFIFASALAQKFGKNLVIVRKEGKLPPPSFSEAYMREYGPATFELKPATPINIPPSQGGQGESRAPRIVLIDDVLATGGTLRAAADLCTRAGYDVVGLATLINLKFLNDFEWNGLKVNAVVEYE